MSNEMIQFLIGSVAILIGAGVGLFFAAVVLRGSVGLANVIVGGELRIPEPSMGWSMMVMLSAGLATFIPNWIVVGISGGFDMTTVILTSLISLFVYGVVFKLMLPTSYSRSFLVSFLNCVISASIWGLIAGAAGMILT